MDIHTASADDISRYLLAVQDRLTELVAEDRLTLAGDAEWEIGTPQGAVQKINRNLGEARQVLSWLETRN